MTHGCASALTSSSAAGPCTERTYVGRAAPTAGARRTRHPACLGRRATGSTAYAPCDMSLRGEGDGQRVSYARTGEEGRYA